MVAQLKAGLIVLVLSALVWRLAMPLLSGIVPKAVLGRRMKVWMALTAIAFLSPSFWLWLMLAVPIILIGLKDDDHPMAVVLVMMHVITNSNIEIPVLEIGRLFSLSNYRILSLLILLPVAIKLANVRHVRTSPQLRVADWGILAYMALQVLLMLPYESYTASLRRVVTMSLDIWLVYYVFSRCALDRRHFQDAMAMLFLGGALAGAAGIAEAGLGWYVYMMDGVWKMGGGMPSPLMRGSLLRVVGPLGQPLSLATYLAFSILALLFIRDACSRQQRLWYAALGWMLVALAATVSRGPAIGLVLGALTFFSVHAKRPAVPRALLAVAAAGAVALATPLGDSVVELLSSLAVDTGELDPSIAYRQQLAQVSWMLIQQFPILGNPFIMGQMEELRQGQGIIDQVNTYAAVTVASGVVGLSVWLFVPLLSVWTILRAGTRLGRVDSGRKAVILAFAACLAFTLTVMSFAYVIPYLYWATAAWAAALAAQSAMPVSSQAALGAGRTTASQYTSASAASGAAYTRPLRGRS